MYGTFNRVYRVTLLNPISYHSDHLFFKEFGLKWQHHYCQGYKSKDLSIIFGNLYSKQTGQCRKIDATYTSIDAIAKDLEECKLKCNEYPKCYAFDLFGSCALYTSPEHYGNGKPGTTCYIKEVSHIVTPDLFVV